jgi:PPOX class probable F420-dependent enzyme
MPTRLTDLPCRPIGGQPEWEPTELERFVAVPRIAVLVYLRKDGRPCQTPIWYRYLDGRIVMTAQSNAPKVHALRRDPRVCVTIQDEAAPYRAVIIEGVAELAALPPGEHDHESAVRYLGAFGAKLYEEMTAEEYAETGTTQITVEPQDVRGFDNLRALKRHERAFMTVRKVLPAPLKRL